jgi:hypothetical protein
MRGGKAFWPEIQTRGLTSTTCEGIKRSHRRGRHKGLARNGMVNFNAILNDDSLCIELLRIMSAAAFTREETSQIYTSIFWKCLFDRLCGLVVRVLDYRSGGPGSIPGTTRKKVVGSGTGCTQPREYN